MSQQLRQAFRDEHPMITRLRVGLALSQDPAVRFDVGLIRVSAKGVIAKLQDNEDTGVGVYGDLEDFQALTALPADPRRRGWLAISYADFHPEGRQTVFGWVGLVGQTIFVTVADSAAEANLPPDPGDIAGIGRNAFVDLLVAAAYAGRARNIFAPFRSRWWRHDLWANYLMEAINRGLPRCQLWEGGKVVATRGEGKLVTDIEGRQAATYAEVFAEQTFEKGIRHLIAGGQWDRTERELPFGLRRRRIVTGEGVTKLDLTVEEHERFRPIAEQALVMLARGDSWPAIGAYLGSEQVPMPGTKGKNKTFAEYSSTGALIGGTKTLILKHLDYYEHGEFTVRRTTKLTMDEIRGIPLDYDERSGRRFKDVVVKGFPHRPFLTAAQWKAVHARLDDPPEARSRRTGAAAHEHDGRVSAFRGVTSWTQEDGMEGVLVPDSPTAYRWRIRPVQDRGWDNHEGEIEATLRKPVFDHAFGVSFLQSIREVSAPLIPWAQGTKEDPLAPFQERVDSLTLAVANADRDGKIADNEIREAGEDAAEVAHWRAEGRRARKERRSLQEQLGHAHAALAQAAAHVVEEVEIEDADVTEPVLVATLMLNGDGRCDPLVADGLAGYGITKTIRLERHATRPDTVVATAVATLETLEGSIVEVPITWECPDSHSATGVTPIIPAIIRTWATGLPLEDVAGQFPGLDVADVRRTIKNRFKKPGAGYIAHRGLRAAAVDCPIRAIRSILAARVLGESQLAAGYPDSLIDQVEQAYFQGTPRVPGWCDGGYLDDARRILAVFENRPDLWDDGLDSDGLARLASVPQPRIRQIARHLGILEIISYRGLRPRRCSHPDCPTKPALTVYVPAPETGRGLICAKCWRADGLDAVLGAEYTQPWRRTAGGSYEATAAPIVAPAVAARDRLLTISEAASALRIPAHLLRTLDQEGELLPAERGPNTVGRLYSRALLDSISEEQLANWRARSMKPPADGLVSSGEAAALLNVDGRNIRNFVGAGLLPVAETTAGGHRRYRREDVESIDASAYGLSALGHAAGLVGLPISSLRDLAATKSVTSSRTPLGTYRFDIDVLRAELGELGLLASSDNPIVAIGVLADHPEVRLPQWIVRKLSDEGHIPVAGRLGGKRRYRLQDAIAGVEKARSAGWVPPLPDPCA